MQNLVSLTCPSLQKLDKTQTGYFRFLDFWSTVINGNCHNSRTSNDIDMNPGPATKLDKRNTATSKKIDDNVMSVNCDVIAIFPIYGQFGAIRKPDSGRIACKTYIFINSKFLSNKNWKQN